MADITNGFQRCYISLKVNGNETNISPMSFSITEFDSIYQLYPKVKMGVSDYEGLMNEYLAWIDGTSVEITFGQDEENCRKCKFVVAKNAVPQQQTSSNNVVGGNFEINLIHDYYYSQVKTSKAYQSNISDIISSLAKKYNFDKIDIENTLNSGYWYQPYINDSEFIMDYLLPFAFSNSSQNTPFYCWIDSNNEFHFKSFQSMFNSTSLKELTYGTIGTDIVANDKIFSSINFFQLELSKLRPYFNTNYYSYDKDGLFSENNDILSDYMKTKGKYPIIGDSTETTNIISLYDDDIKLDDTINNNKGYKTNLHKEVILPDKIIINTILDKSLVSGNIIKISLPMPSSDETEKSLKNSGTYLIESSYHTWNAQSARTTLICSKQNVVLSTNYRNNNLLFN